MKIFQIIPTLELAGAEIMCENLATELKELGHKVTVISLYNYETAITERLRENGIKVVFLEKKQGFDFSVFLKLFSILKKEEPDVIHTHLYAVRYAVPVAMMCGVKIKVHTVHNLAQEECGKIGKIMNHIYFKFLNVIPVALSEMIRESITEEYGMKKQTIPVIFNGIDLRKCRVKKKYEINKKFKIVHVGRFSEQKNHQGLIRAYMSFYNKYPNSELWLIGDGVKKMEIEQYVRDNSIEDNVKFLGVQKEVYKYLHEADIFTLPSNYEGVPLSLIEAMGTGLPIVVTAVGGVPDMVDENCAIVTEVDNQELANAYEEYYLNEELRRKHGRNALQKSREFSAKVMAKKYEMIYTMEKVKR